MSAYGKQLVKKIKTEQEKPARARISLYVDSKLAKRFMAACKKEGLSASIVVEGFMKDFVGE